MIATMPSLDLEALARQRAESVLIKLKNMNISLPSANVDQWKDLNYNDQAWNTMTLPSLWEQQQLEDIDGTIWFRKTITLTSADAGKEATLKLSMIDDTDQSYVNGVLVGSTNRYNEKRIYQVPANVLKEGKNVIAVRVEDTGGGGGIYGDATDLSLITKGNTSISLAGAWQYNIESLLANANSIGPNTYPTLLFNAMLNPLTAYTIHHLLFYSTSDFLRACW